MATTEEVFEKIEAGAQAASEEKKAGSLPADDAKPKDQAAELELTDAEKAAAAEKPVAEVEEEVVEPNIEEAPESSGDFGKYKHLYKENPDLRHIIGREQAFSQLGNYSEVKQVIERIPTLEDAEKLTSEAESFRNLGENFRGNQAEFLDALKESDANAYTKLVTQMPMILAERDADLYGQQARYYVNTVMSRLAEIATSDKDEEVVNALKTLAARGYVNFSGAPAPSRGSSEATRLREQLAERDKADADAQFKSFWGSTDTIIIENCATEIDSLLRSKLTGTSDVTLHKIGKEIYDKTLAVMMSQPETKRQFDNYEKLARGGKRGLAEQKMIVDFATKRAKLTIPKVAQSVIDEWSKDVLLKNKKEIETKKGIADKTKDVGSGPQGTSGAAGGTGTNGAKRTSADVFRELESGTYVAPSRR